MNKNLEIDVTEIDRLSVINTQPGDVLVLRSEIPISAKALENFTAHIGNASGLKVIILDRGMSLEAVLSTGITNHES